MTNIHGSTTAVRRPHSLVSDLMRPGRIRDLASKLWVRVRFRLLALARPRTTMRRHRALRGKTVVIYTLGKVGSSSIYHSLLRSFPFRHIFHVHFMSGEWLDRRLPGTAFAREVRSGRRALTALKKPSQTTLYICMVRDPIARDLSNVIQNHHANEIDINGLPMDAVVTKLRSEGHGFGELWFHTEFSEHIGRDILSFPFDRSRGYAIHRIDDSRQLLLVTLESLNVVFDEALSRFLGVDVDQQFRFNESSAKPEAEFYAALKSVYLLPEAELAKVYDTPLMRHFYTDETIAGFKAQWEAK
ncbi:putative capsular polysaccharide synthesis family protein [Actibacterium sp. D379-3]